MDTDSARQHVPANATEVVRELCADITERAKGRIGTHYAGCWREHLACFAYRVDAILREAEDDTVQGG
jgi:hypothetical protein